MRIVDFKDTSGAVREKVWRLYEESFPAHERRSLTAQEQAFADCRARSKVMLDDEGEVMALVFYWLHAGSPPSQPLKNPPRRKVGMPMNDKWEIIHGDALKLLGQFAPGTFDAIITDPPYASGGRTQAEKNKSTAKKYSSMGDHAPPPFDGDAKDQRSWTRWAAEWLGDARKICKPGAPVCMFIDWRQLPAATDALQWAGWIWRGTAVWDKGNSRPQKGRFRQQAEYIVWGSNGDMPISRPVPCLPGVFKYGNPQNRIHLTEKPLPLMRDVVKITEPGGHILDPFAGSGTTVLAAVLEGYTATGIEVTDEYARRARERIEQELCQAA